MSAVEAFSTESLPPFPMTVMEKSGTVGLGGRPDLPYPTSEETR
jgi:hypothetical protein